MSRKICTRLGINRCGQPYIQSKLQRHEFDCAVRDRLNKTPTVNDVVVTRGGVGILTEVGDDGSCTVEVMVDGIKNVHKYKSMDKKKGGGRVRLVSPSFGTYMDKKRADALPQSTKDSVRQFYKDHCTESPNAKDRMRRRKGVRNFEYAQKLIMNCTFDELYSSFQKMYPYMRISRTSFYLLRPWNLRHCKRETCLCRVCENYSGYTATLAEVGKMLEDAYTTNDEDDEMDVDTTATERECVDRLIEMSKKTKKHEHMSCMLCKLAFTNADVGKTVTVKGDAVQIDGASRRVVWGAAKHHNCTGTIKSADATTVQLEDGQKFDNVGKAYTEACVNGTCKGKMCGFKSAWSGGVRQLLVGKKGEIISGMPGVWLKKVTWQRFAMVEMETKKPKCPDKDDGNDDDYHACGAKAPPTSKRLDTEDKNGTVIDFLDELESIFVPMCKHRHTLAKCKAAAVRVLSYFCLCFLECVGLFMAAAARFPPQRTTWVACIGCGLGRCVDLFLTTFGVCRRRMLRVQIDMGPRHAPRYCKKKPRSAENYTIEKARQVQSMYWAQVLWR